jgi:hypothetical protein
MLDFAADRTGMARSDYATADILKHRGRTVPALTHAHRRTPKPMGVVDRRITSITSSSTSHRIDQPSVIRVLNGPK